MNAVSPLSATDHSSLATDLIHYFLLSVKFIQSCPQPLGPKFKGIFRSAKLGHAVNLAPCSAVNSGRQPLIALGIQKLKLHADLSDASAFSGKSFLDETNGNPCWHD